MIYHDGDVREDGKIFRRYVSFYLKDGTQCWSLQWLSPETYKNRKQKESEKSKQRRKTDSKFRDKSKVWKNDPNNKLKTLQSNRKYHREYKRKTLPIPTRPESEFCECCGRLPGKNSINLDHCHLSNTFRGWLCHRCNTGIGMLGDNREGILKALAYLDRI